MVDSLIICRSLTYAQRTARALANGGIPGHITRAPQGAGEGCTHAVRVGEGNLGRALTVLKRAGLAPRRVFLRRADGTVSEVEV